MLLFFFSVFLPTRYLRTAFLPISFCSWVEMDLCPEYTPEKESDCMVCLFLKKLVLSHEKKNLDDGGASPPSQM